MSIDKPAIGIHIIQRDKPGSFPKIIADLSGIQFKQTDCTHIPSFHYSRYQNCAFGKKQVEKYFYYTADITLEEKPKNDNEEKIGAVVLSLPSPSERDDVIKYINKLLFNSDKLGSIKIPNEEYIKVDNILNKKEHINHLLKNCIFQVTTSPETYRAKLFNLFKNWDFYGDQEFKKEDAIKEIGRAYIDTTFSYSKDIPKGSPLAKLYLCCRYGDQPGALAAAINTLLFRVWKNFQDKKYIFNIMFYIDYFSFASGVAYDAIYGKLARSNKRIDEGKLKDVIERILICPITEVPSSSWYDEYAIKLYYFLNGTGYKYEIEPKQENVQNKQNISNILIYRDNKSPCEICGIREDGEQERRPNKGCDICRKFWWPPTGLKRR